ADLSDDPRFDITAPGKRHQIVPHNRIRVFWKRSAREQRFFLPVPPHELSACQIGEKFFWHQNDYIEARFLTRGAFVHTMQLRF
ncbi:MAG: hypothetical protein ACXWC0_18645, partial [Burkholderiales bacterium]